MTLLLTLLCTDISLYANEDYNKQIKHNEHEGIKNKFIGFVNNTKISDEVKVFLLSMSPVFELRLSIPFGIAREFNFFGIKTEGCDLPPLKVLLISILGNTIPAILIILFFDALTILLYKIPYIKRILESFFSRVRKKGKIIEEYEEMGLILFVAVPLPGAGAWTGAFLAYIFGLDFWKSTLIIFIGVIFAGIIVTALTLLGWTGAIIATVCLILMLFFHIHKTIGKSHKRNNPAE